MKVLIAIPAYNCERQISRTLNEIDDRLFARVEEVAVFDNGSPDNTVGAALDVAQTRGDGKIKVYRNTRNVNLGGTHKIAFLKAQKMGCTHVVILHGDNQAKSDEAHLLLDAAEAGPEQTILGSRFNAASSLQGYDAKRIYGNKALNLAYTALTGRHCEDLGSGLNVFALADLDQEQYLQFADALTFNYELLLDLIRRRRAFRYVPITWREEDQVSNARNFKIATTALKNLLRWRFNALGYTGAPDPATYSCEEVTR